jgi:hypothetical protein
MSSAQSSPVAVVWCRQVDNEAESPGYTTIPEDFMGHPETLDAIRIVGNLTINVADTQDYWDPDPTQPLSYYPNLFLYPAFGGRYTCVGRMFLSTEDRPRLGMKTLVLATSQLLATGEFGPTVLKWHASMGGPRPAGARPPPIPDPRLVGLLGEGFVFHRGSTDPVLIIASDDWDGAMQIILEMVRVMPASLTALGAILAFPYFLPQPKTNIHELSEQIPLSLSLMRIARREAVGERHAQRIAAWEKTSLTVRDLTQDWTGTGNRSKDNLPLVLQYVRDHTATKLGPIVQRVDLVEGGQRQERLFDADHLGGRDRRKEMWRIGTAMESAALLLSRARGRHVPVNVETARRAQQYLQVRLPSGETVEPEESLLDEAPSPFVSEAPRLPGQIPPWLQRAAEPMPVARTERVEVVPISVSDDPSLLPPTPKPTEPISPPAPVVRAPPPPAASPVVSTPLPPPPPPPATAPAVAPMLDIAALRLDIERDLLKYVDKRWPAPAAISTSVPPAWEDRFREQERQLNQRLEESNARWQTALTQAEGGATALEAFQTSFEQRMAELNETQNKAIVGISADLTRRMEELGNRQRLNTLQEIAAAETHLRDALGQSIVPEVERRFRSIVDQRFQDVEARLTEALKPRSAEIDPRVRSELRRVEEELKSHIAQKEEELRSGISAQMDLHLKEIAEEEQHLRETLLASVPAIIDARIEDQDVKVQRSLKETEGRLAIAMDGRTRDGQEQVANALKDLREQVGTLVDARLSAHDSKIQSMTDARVQEMEEANRAAIADLQVRMEAHFDQRLREAQDLEREKYVELIARLKGEVESNLGRLFVSPQFDAAVLDRLGQAFEQFRSDSQKLLETRLGAAEARIRADQSEGVRRLSAVEKELESRGKELFRIEETIRTDLDEMDRRMEVLTDRLVPIVRKTWLRIGELEKVRFPVEDPQAKVEQLRRDHVREIRHLQQEITERTNEIRDRMEATIANQGKVWLAVIQQMSQNAVSRRADVRGRAADDEFALEAVPVANPATAPGEDIPNIFDPSGDGGPLRGAEPERAARRRTRRSASDEL